jgi:hypothetical protein
VAAAGTLATLCVLVAMQQLASLGKTPAKSAKGFKGPIRGETPDFWLRDHAAGRAEAQRTGKPIFLVIRCEP